VSLSSVVASPQQTNTVVLVLLLHRILFVLCVCFINLFLVPTSSRSCYSRLSPLVYMQLLVVLTLARILLTPSCVISLSLVSSLLHRYPLYRLHHPRCPHRSQFLYQHPPYPGTFPLMSVLSRSHSTRFESPRYHRTAPLHRIIVTPRFHVSHSP